MANKDELFSVGEVKEYVSPVIRNICAILIMLSMTLNSLGFNFQQIMSAWSTAYTKKIEAESRKAEGNQLINQGYQFQILHDNFLILEEEVNTQADIIRELQEKSHDKGSK